MISADSGSGTNWYARHVKMGATLSGTLATVGCGVPYAIGAKFARTDRPAVATVGDGAMQMNGMAELITIAKYWTEWADPRCVIMVVRNDELNQVTLGVARDGRLAVVPAVSATSEGRLRAFATSVGLHGITSTIPVK